MTVPQKPIRILRIVTHLNISGPTVQAVLLVARMQDETHESRLVGGAPFSDADSVLSLAERYGLDPIILPDMHAGYNPFAHWRTLRDLMRIMREFKPDVVHTHATTAGFLGRIAARLTGVPVVVHTLHVHPFRGYYNRLRTLNFIMMERIGAYLSDSIVTLSENLRRELTDTHRIARKNRFIVLPLGFDLEPFQTATPAQGQAFREKYGIPADVPLVGIIGRLLPVKHVDLFLEAAEIIHQTIPQAHFVIVGDGEERIALTAQARSLGISDHVTFTGWIDQMPDVYAALDVVASSSLNEGTPVPIIEALSAGCRVVATDVGGVRDLLNNGALGRLVPSGDASALAGAVISALNQPYDAADAQETMDRWYGIDRLVSDLDSLYRGLLSMKRTRRKKNGS